MRIARLTAVWISGQRNTDDYESYVWNGASWQHTISPRLFVPDKPQPINLDLSKMGRSCTVRSKLTDEDAEKIIAAFDISEADLHREKISLGEVRTTHPARLEEIRDNKSAQQASR